MEITSSRKKKRTRTKESTEVQYMNSLQFYNVPPTETISLHEFEEYAIERLKVLKAVEVTGIKHLRGSEEYEDALHKELRKTIFKDIFKEDVSEKTMRIDYISHFILRLAYCRSDDLRHWFLQQEMDLFRFRFEKLRDHPDAIVAFLQANNLHYTPIDKTEKDSVYDKLFAASHGKLVIETTDFYKVAFIEAIELIRNRKVYLHRGFAYVSQNDFVAIILSVYRSHLSRALALTSRSLPKLDEDTRLLSLLDGLSKRYLGQDYSSSKATAGEVTANMIDTLSKKSFPPCMQQLHRELQQSHHLKHWGRMQYGLFLKGIGLSLDEALKFWRTEFSRIMDVDKFEKQYSYSIRHNYGKEGKRTDYTPYSCMKIITANPPSQGDHHGCPFRHTDIELLRQRFKSTGISNDNIDSIVKYTKGGHCQLACARYFEVTHGLPEETNFSLQHPNQYFEESQRYIKGTKVQATKTTVRVIKTMPSQSYQPQSSLANESDILDTSDMSGIGELMDTTDFNEEMMD